MSDDDLKIDVRRSGQKSEDGDTGWKLYACGDRITISGGTYDDAHGPVRLNRWKLEQFITDLRSLSLVWKKP